MIKITIEPEGNSLILSGKINGRLDRFKFHLHRLDRDDNEYLIIFSPKFINVNVSYFKGLFMDSMKYLGPNRFHKKYHFKSTRDTVISNIADGIDQCKKYYDLQ